SEASASPRAQLYHQPPARRRPSRPVRETAAGNICEPPDRPPGRPVVTSPVPLRSEELCSPSPRRREIEREREQRIHADEHRTLEPRGLAVERNGIDDKRASGNRHQLQRVAEDEIHR